MPDPNHFMLEEALAEGYLKVEEVDEGGSVPELVVVNDSDNFVLLLDGEEVAGAKQNRVLNTTILLDKRSRTKVPVSCTEQGRWAYNSKNFSHSGNIMSSKLRRRKTRTVTQSLRACKSFASNQGEVWDSIAEIHAEAGTSSKTGAMKDAFEDRQEQLKEYTDAIAPVENQVGLLVFIDDKPAGLDLFARPRSFSKVASQLTQSYAMDALTSRDKKESGTVTIEDASGFLSKLEELKEDPFDSIGIGSDFRYEGPQRNGTALLVEETPVHAAFFSTADDSEADSGSPRSPRMSSFTQRRNFLRNLGRNDDNQEEQEQE